MKNYRKGFGLLTLFMLLFTFLGVVHGQGNETYVVSSSAYRNGNVYIKFIDPDTYHYYLFDGQAGDIVDIVVRGYDGLRPEIGLSSPSGEGLGLYLAGEDTEVGMRSFTLPETGQYRVRIDGNSRRSQYAFWVDYIARRSIPSPTSSPSDSADTSVSRYGCIASADQTQDFTLAGMSAGDLLYVRMYSLSSRFNDGNLDPYIRVYSSSGELLAYNDDVEGLNAGISGFRFPYSGDYTVEASSYGSTTGPFSIAVNSNSNLAVGVPQNNPCDSVSQPSNSGSTGNTVSPMAQYGCLTYSNPTLRYPINDVRAGSVLYAYMLSLSDNFGDGDLDPYLSIYGPDGNLIAENDDFQGTLNAGFSGIRLPATGDYMIEVSSYGDTLGPFNLVVNGNSTLDVGIPPNNPCGSSAVSPQPSTNDTNNSAPAPQPAPSVLSCDGFAVTSPANGGKFDKFSGVPVTWVGLNGAQSYQVVIRNADDWGSVFFNHTTNGTSATADLSQAASYMFNFTVIATLSDGRTCEASANASHW